MLKCVFVARRPVLAVAIRKRRGESTYCYRYRGAFILDRLLESNGVFVIERFQHMGFCAPCCLTPKDPHKNTRGAIN
jgi:hypothetical protein